MKRLLLATLFSLSLSTGTLAGWEQGSEAYQRRDYATALAELKPLAESGHAGALSRLGHMNLHGFGVPRNEAEGVRMITKAAEQGDAMAQNTLGGLYFKGMAGLPRDPARALMWIGRAAEQGQPNALNNMGQFYFQGNGIGRDEVRALDYLRRAADQGIAASWETIGIAYWNGRGVAQDRTEAVRWLRRAAENDLMVAQNLLGAALWNGDGAPKDQAEAVRWFEKAAMQGDAPSAFNVGQAHMNGIGAAKDLERGYYFLALAAQNAKANDKQRFMEARDKARQSISPDQEARASERLRAWRPFSGGIAAPAEASAVSPGPAPVPARAPAPPAPTQRAPLSTGSGIVVSRDGVVLTNAHVVPGCRAIRVTVGESPAIPATLLARDETNDLAAIRTAFKPPVVARFREDKPLRSGDGIVVVGYPLSTLLSREANVTAGVVSALAGLKGDKRQYQITAPVQKGNSGGPLADMSGNVVGIVNSKLNAMKVAENTGDLPQNVNFAIKAELARKFLGDNLIPYETGPATATLSPADVGETIKKVTALIECEG